MAGTKNKPCNNCIYSVFVVWLNEGDDKCYKCIKGSKYKAKTKEKKII